MAVLVVVVACAALPGCEWRGLNSLTLPGTDGSGDGSYTIQAQLPDVVTIQENTRVRVADVNVGNVTKIEVQDWHALVTMRINGDVHLPANSPPRSGRPVCSGRCTSNWRRRRTSRRGRAEERLGDSAVRGEHLSDHRADAGIGVDPAQRWRAGSASGDQPGDRQGFRRAVRTTCAAC